MINTYQSDYIDVENNDATYNIDYNNTDDPVIKYLGGTDAELKDVNAVIREESGKKNYMVRHRSPIDGCDEFWETLDDKSIEAEKAKATDGC